MTKRNSENLGELFKSLDHKYSLTEAAAEMCSLKVSLHLRRQVILLNIVRLRTS